MSTEYRRGIPSTAHVEAATRLGLLWEDTIHMRFTGACLLEAQVLPNASFRPIRPDGTPVDWEVLDQEVARVGQQGQPQTMACNLTASAQPQGFRADLWARVSRHFSLVFRSHNQVSSLTEISNIDDVGIHSPNWQWGWATADREAPTRQNRADILARWTVYQELKPLYDLIDDCPVGRTVSLPVDVFQEWARGSHSESVREIQDALTRDPEWVASRLSLSSHFRRNIQLRGPYCSWYSDGGSATDAQAQKLSNFAAVLDAVAERRVAEQHQAQAPTVTAAQPAQPDPRRFANVRPDRHGWRWWRDLTNDYCFTLHEGVYVQRVDAASDPWSVLDLSVWLDRTVIPTDEQGNPVSWESIGPTDPTEIRLTSASNAPDRHGTRWAASVSAMQNYAVPGIYVTVGTGAKPTQTEAITTLPLPLPRFTADELDDVDHSRTTKLDEVTLCRGKLPTVEQIAKYREVRARRAGGTVADALKESHIDCEVAQYVLERWAGGLGDADTVLLLRAAGCIVSPLGWRSSSVRAFDPKQSEVDRRTQNFLRMHNVTLDTSEKPSHTVQRERQEAEERRQRLAELRQRLAAERAAQPQEMAKGDAVSRFDLIEPDPQADPAASIRAWEASQAAAKVRPAAAPPRIAKPAAAPRRPAIEVVDAEVDGLSRVDVVTALVGRAFNGGC